jgi:deoxyadenosine/deoxycytidine kinase
MNDQMTNHKTTPIIITIEGNIGSGKTTFIKELINYEKMKNTNTICFLQEPVNMWESIKNKSNETMIECFYENQEKYAFPFQIMAYVSRMALIKQAILNGYKYIFTERCIYTDRNVFLKMLYESNKVEKMNYEIYNMLFETFTQEYNIYHIYIQTSPEVALKRVIKRERAGENNISLEYLTMCNCYHNDWLVNNKKNIMKFDVNEDDWLKPTYFDTILYKLINLF